VGEDEVPDPSLRFQSSVAMKIKIGCGRGIQKVAREGQI
jgi:hypothetical protein